MPLIAIHLVRTVKGAPREPVGAWEIDGDTATPFYPAEHQKYHARGEKALLERPTESLEAWIHYLAHKSPSWRFPTLGVEPLLDEANPDLVQTYLDEQRAFRKQVALLSEQDAASRVTVEADPDSDPVSGAGWGATRVALAQSWWIASELVRRHPQLLAYEMHPGGGQYDVLCVTEPASLSPQNESPGLPRVMLNRVGTLQVHRGDDSDVVATWAQVIESATPHSIVKELEARAGWGSPRQVPATTARTLAYRLFASLLTVTLNSRFPWDVRCEFVDSSGDDDTRAGFLAAFPAAVESVRSTPPIGIRGEPESHFWALRRGDETVAIVSIEGQAFFTGGKQVDLMSEYDKHNHRLVPMTVALFKQWL